MKKSDYFPLLSLVSCLVPSLSYAQITPDVSLPINSTVTQQGNVSTIEGGTARGTNLFHSFEQFSIPTNREAFFNNSLGIENIFTRVTGKSISNIDGVIRANGRANLFLLNPNGILFGPNASLNIGGSFIATTANQINFADGSFFSSECCSNQPLLTISIPIGLRFGSNPGPIVNQSQATILSPQNSPTITGLQVSPGQTLALIGGEIRLDGGYLTAPTGQILLGSVASASAVSLISTHLGYSVNYEGVENFGDIQLSNLAKVDASGIGGGEIQIQGRNLILTGGAKINSNTFGAIDGKNIIITTTDSVQLLGTTDIPGLYEQIEASFGLLIPLRSSINAYTFAEGNAGAITINSKNLILQNGGRINTSSISIPGTTGLGIVQGKGGDITINASNLIDINGVVQVQGKLRNSTGIPGLERFFSEVFGATDISTVSSGRGEAGQITINTSKLLIRNGGLITANPFSTGRGGNITISATDFVQLMGTSPSGEVSSNIVTTALNSGDAGDITINTRELMILNGASLSTQTGNIGNGGNLTINATNSVTVAGLSNNGFSTLTASASSSGAAGNLTINTAQLRIIDGGQVRVSSQGTGKTGNLQVNAQNIYLDNGTLTGSTVFGEGGNIDLQIEDILQMRGNSVISVESRGNGDGGNIFINIQGFLTTLENSDITANSQSAAGGNIRIQADGIFGTKGGRQQTPQSDITATGVIQGFIELNTLETDPTYGIQELPAQVIDPSTLIAQNPCQKGTESELTLTGRGGLPSTPKETLTQSLTAVELVEPTATPITTKPLKSQPITSPQTPIEPAQGWVFNEQGEVVLVAQNSSVTPSQRLPQTPPSCPAP